MKQDVWIIGAGPVGLVLSHLLDPEIFTVQLYEKRPGPPDMSMAIGITPPSRKILDRIGVGAEFEQQGVAIRRAAVFENGHPVGQLDFRNAGDHILALPQSETLRILRNSLAGLPHVTFHENETFRVDTPVPESVWLIGCDGHRSTVRQRAGIRHTWKVYRPEFLMADLEDVERAGPDARIFFSPHGSLESFPLPDGKRRWVAQRLPDQPAALDTLLDRIRKNTGLDLGGAAHSPPLLFRPRRALASTFYRERTLLCGDAAHQLSPIGGQGMNTGLADAWQLAGILNTGRVDRLPQWNRERRRVFRHASARAAAGMTLGTRTGPVASRLRGALLRQLLNRPLPSGILARTFAMQNLPGTVPC